jgi:hypothetical protein
VKHHPTVIAPASTQSKFLICIGLSKGLERTTKQRLNAFLLRYGRIYQSDKSRWTQAHFRWQVFVTGPEGLKVEIQFESNQAH